MSQINKQNDRQMSEIHLRRMAVADALYLLEGYLDRSFVSGLKAVRVVHGKGTGVLKAAVREMLESHPLVVGYRDGYIGEGDAGVTVVELEDRNI